MAIINIIAGTAGTIDGVIETGMSINDCNSDKWDVIASAGTTVANFASIFKILQISGGKAAMDITLYNAARKRSIGLNEIYGAGAAIAGLVGMAPLAVVLSVGGLLLTLNDFFGKGGRNNNCYDPNSPEAQLAGIIPGPGGAPNLYAAMLASPLIIDMDGNGIKTISINKNVLFDLDNNLFAENTGWVDKGDAFLVWDRDGNSMIDSGNELFGNHSLLQNGEKAANGFAALAELDSNKDKVFDASDEAWAKLQLWFDHNQNGISEEGELIRLADSQIKNINLNYQDINRTDESGNTHRQHSSVTWADGKTTDINDVWFATNPALSYSRQQIEISDDIKTLPNVIAFGNVLNLHQAMATNSTLKNYITVK